MINLLQVKKFCNGDISLIENYQQAINDNTQTWECHHRMGVQPDGTRLTRKWMKEHEIYYKLDPCMLIFLTSAEHKRIHNLGRKLNQSTKHKMSISRMNNTNNTGKIKSEFDRKFYEHYHITSKEDIKLYKSENDYYRRHNHKCSWEA